MGDPTDESYGPTRAVSGAIVIPARGPMPGTSGTSAPRPATPSAPRPAGAGEDKVMSLVEHLDELRRRIAISLVAVIVGSAVGFFVAPTIIEILLDPLPGGKVVFLSMTGGFMVYLRIAVIIGILLALPIILYQLWAFVAPGLTPRERRAALPWIPLTIVFFLLGAGVAYVTMPYAIAFLLSFQIIDVLESFPTAEHYFGFVTTIFLVFGAVMQFPVALVLLAKLGVLSLERLRASRRYAAVGIIVFAVVVTPGGDPISPLVMSAVMYVLYEITILLMGRGAPETDA